MFLLKYMIRELWDGSGFYPWAYFPTDIKKNVIWHTQKMITHLCCTAIAEYSLSKSEQLQPPKNKSEDSLGWAETLCVALEQKLFLWRWTVCKLDQNKSTTRRAKTYGSHVFWRHSYWHKENSIRAPESKGSNLYLPWASSIKFFSIYSEMAISLCWLPLEYVILIWVCWNGLFYVSISVSM